MQLPFFYIPDYDPSGKEIMLGEESSRHIVQVLRKSIGDRLHLTDGKGRMLTAIILDNHKKHCRVKVETEEQQQGRQNKTSIAISLVKNSSRFEWFLEKATELGVSEIIPLLCTRTEKQNFRRERMQGILISAMLQSRQSWLPVLHKPVAFELLFRMEEVSGIQRKFIAHCVEGTKNKLYVGPNESSIVLIGPEGDFTSGEIELALASRFVPVSLGETRLRTETAGVAAAVLLSIG